jgi:hypothetical protein
MTGILASSIREARRSRPTFKFLVKFGDRNGSWDQPSIRHVIRAAPEQFVDRSGNSVASPERDDLSVEVVGLDVAGAS